MTFKFEPYLDAITSAMTNEPWHDGKPAKVIHLTNNNGMSVSVMDVGATWLSCRLPIGNEPHTGFREVLLRSLNMTEHKQQQAYLGAVVGRFANRIKDGQFSLGERVYTVVNNEGRNSLHGGGDGFDKRRWKVRNQTEQAVTFTLFSVDGDQGYPGNSDVSVTYTLTEQNRVQILYQATCDQDCPVNLTNHAYFNLDGESSDRKSLDHYLKLEASRYLPTEKDMIPTGEECSVEGTGFDFRVLKRIATDFLDDADQKTAGGYDHTFVFDQNASAKKVCLVSPDQQITMNIETTKPSVQFYSGNFLQGAVGASKPYQNYDGVALETQFFPDGPNHPQWGMNQGILKAGDRYCHQTDFEFEW